MGSTSDGAAFFAQQPGVAGRRRARRQARLEPPDVRTRPRQASPGLSAILGAAVGGVRLTAALFRDDRVPGTDKLAAGAALAYLASPVDVVLDVVPVIGQLDDLAILVWAWRRLIQGAGYDVIADHWSGDPEALDVVLAVAGVEQ